jgi:hypothetical protein
MMMTWLTVSIARIRAFFRAAHDDRELTQELDAHVAMAVEEYVRRGMPRDQARRLAHQELGGLTQLREAHHEVRGLPLLDTILQDLRYALRTLRRDPGFTVFAIAIIGLGIAASATVFSVINAVLLRPLPFRDADRLVWISNGGPGGDLFMMTEPAHYLDLRCATGACSGRSSTNTSRRAASW